MPQSSRMIVTFRASRSQRATSTRRWAWRGKASRRLLASSSIDRNGRSRGKSEVHRACGIDLNRSAGNEVEIRPGGHAGRDGRVETRGFVVDRDKTFGAARERNRIGAVVPPMIDVGASDPVPEADHLENRRIAVLADPLTGRRRAVDARRARHGEGPAIPVRRRAHRVLGWTVECIAREDRWIAVRLREHPDVGVAEDVAVAVAQAAVVLRVVTLEEHDRLIRRHQPPRRGGELVARWTIGIELRDVLAIDVAELVADAGESELGDVGGAARAVTFAIIVLR